MSKISLTCPHCGSDQFIHPENPNLESKVTCMACNTTLTIAEMAGSATRQEAVRLATETARATLGKLLK
jgi:transposase-like protein